MTTQRDHEGWFRVNSPVTPPDRLLHCMVDGCPAKASSMEGIEEHFRNVHDYDQMVNAAINGVWFSQLQDPIQTETTNVYVRAFLEWVRHQNSIEINETHAEGEDPFVRVPLIPTDEEINTLIDTFIELDYRFGN